jgi:cytidylate kinase
MEPVNSAVKSSELGTNHYNGPSYMGKSEELFSVNYGNANNGFTVSPSFAFSNTSGAQTWEKLMAHTTTYSMVDGYLVFNSSNTSTAFTLNDIAKYGFAHNQDESADYMDGWIGSTVGNHAIDIVKPNKEEGIIEFEDKILDLNQYDMTTVPNRVTNFSGSVPINKFGLYLSKNENVRQDLKEAIFRDYLSETPGLNEETLAYVNFLESKGLGPAREIIGYGTEFMPNAIARTRNIKGSILTGSREMGDIAMKIAEEYGLNGYGANNFVRNAIWLHELYHVMDHRKGISEKRIETELGERLAEFFDLKADVLEGKIAEFYRAMTEENRSYAKNWGKGRRSQRSGKIINNPAGKYDGDTSEKSIEDNEAKVYILEDILKELNEGVGENIDGSNIAKNSEKEYDTPLDENYQYEHSSGETDENIQEADMESATNPE